MSASASHGLFPRVQELMREGALADAEAMLKAALVIMPGDPNVMYLRCVIANRRGDPRAAIAYAREVIDKHPVAPFWLALGNAHAQLGELPAALDAYREALVRKPDWPDAHFNIGLSLKRQKKLGEAARAFHKSWLLDAAHPEAAAECVATLATWVKARKSTASLPPVVLDPPFPTVSIIVCSIDDAKAQRVEARYRQLFSALPHELVLIRDARSLADAYNHAVAATRGDIVVLSHDDIDTLADDFAARLLHHLRSFDALGVAGALRVTGPTPSWAGHPHLRGWVTHRAPGDASWRADVFDPRPVAGGIAALDGVLLAARREVLVAVPFDAETFDGFHLYDVDWSYRASQVGFRLAATGDLMLVHESRGRYDERWQHYAARFTAKHALPAAPSPSHAVHFYEAVLDNANQVRAFYAQLAALSA